MTNYIYILKKEDMLFSHAIYETEIYTSKKKLIKEVLKLINAGHDIIKIEKTDIINGKKMPMIKHNNERLEVIE